MNIIKERYPFYAAISVFLLANKLCNKIKSSSIKLLFNKIVNFLMLCFNETKRIIN